jgi:hypothetical protein
VVVANDLPTKPALRALNLVMDFAESLDWLALLVSRKSEDVPRCQKARILATTRTIGAYPVTENPLNFHSGPPLPCGEWPGYALGVPAIGVFTPISTGDLREVWGAE